MTLHTLVHSCDSFSCNCNSIHSFVFHCDLRAFSSFLFLLLRVYINYRDSSTSHFTYYIYSNVTTSTRINIFKCTYVHLCLFHSKLPHWFQYVPIYIGLLANNATWCQNRGCICISSTRRTYGQIHAVSCIHPVIQTITRIILWTELFPKKRREKIQREILQRPHSNSNPRVSSEDPRRDSSFYTQSSILQINSIYRINSTRNTRFILCRLTPATVSHVSKHSTR